VARSLAILSAVLVITVAALIGRCEYSNSRDVPFPADAEIRSSLSRASAWIFAHREQVLSEDNAMLWLFVRDAGRASDDPRLLALAGEYQSRHTGSLWQYIFDSSGAERVAGARLDSLTNLPDYNRLFLYGATCNEFAHWDPEVLSLLSPSACDSHFGWFRSPWCRTHQLMGLRFAEKSL
jgi:hypothetical protein